MKQTFREDFTSEHQDPVDGQVQDFDWEKLYERIGEDAQHGDNDLQLAETVVRLLQLLLGDHSRCIRLRAIGLRVIALAWVLNPAYFVGSPSLKTLSRRCKVNVTTLAHLTGEISRFISWRNRAQRHAWNWRKGHRSRSGGGNDTGGSRRGQDASGTSGGTSAP